MCHHYGWSVAELEDAIPFEMALYTGFTKDYVERMKKARDSG